VIALDTNLLVYAHRPESPWHARTVEVIDGLWSGRRAWGIPVHCLVEFAAVVSNRRLWKAPSQVDHVADQVAAWTESPSCRLLADDETVWEHALALARRGRCEAGTWYDARIAAACLAHGVTELWTADRDYTRFPALRVRNPLVD
jgi:toxin-antitoxin system PIN domain toxin